ncbi:MAG: ATP-binding cassette domain-containing protein [Pseudomonadota bacterium]|nr:ATP-binding cassette domain-containing protein [Pseudomonadota bacterium]
MSKKRTKISIRGLKKSFGSNSVLTGLNLDVTEGESLAVIGGSGSGKSVLVKSILGLIKPDHGSILIDGFETAHVPHKTRQPVTKQIGMLFQNAALFDSLTVWENIAFSLIQERVLGRKKAKEEAIRFLNEVGLNKQTADRYPGEISVGAQKRVGLARAIATKPKIILFDEPTTGIDPIMGDVIDRLIVKCVKDLGATAMTITHDIDSAHRIADRIAMIHGGKIIWIDNAQEIDNSGNQIVDRFIKGQVENLILAGSGAG